MSGSSGGLSQFVAGDSVALAERATRRPAQGMRIPECAPTPGQQVPQHSAVRRDHLELAGLDRTYSLLFVDPGLYDNSSVASKSLFERQVRVFDAVHNASQTRTPLAGPVRKFYHIGKGVQNP